MKDKEVIEKMVEESQKTLDAIRKLLGENIEIPDDIKKQALKEIQKTENHITKLLTRKKNTK
jgi:Lon protease-like protein